MMIAKPEQAVSPDQLRVFRDPDDRAAEPEGISPAAAVAAIEMRRRNRGPGNVQAAWPDILTSMAQFGGLWWSCLNIDP